ncbi:hypothetical protein E1263_36920 [Kribbella antibiotica]|uniref:Uncharacterized protein n=1 Tax=Kribbella antibiotica TaxID=190195 RepID=A0A4R4YMI4_9ACTN|nr:hypothetical protein [Kribbella antibiotica]TDD46231.1 hypothetical protein E1263_36920 [Kribbella antibiotica]
MPTRTGADVMTVLTKVLGIAGVVVLLGGIALGFRSVSSAGAYCGSAFRTAAGLTPMTCDHALSNAGTLVTVVIVVGGLLLAAAVVVKLMAARATATAAA